LLLEAAKLTFADFYFVLITNAPNLNNFRLELLCQLKGLGTRQLLPAVDFLGPSDNSINQFFFFPHFKLLRKTALRYAYFDISQAKK